MLAGKRVETTSVNVKKESAMVFSEGSELVRRGVVSAGKRTNDVPNAD